MEPAARKQLAADWIEEYTHQFAWDTDKVLRPQSLHPYVAGALDELSRSDVEEFLEVVLEIVHSDQSDDVMMHTSGPLQMLIETEPDRVLERVETLAVTDPQFRKLLEWFVPSEPHNEVWSRVRRAAGEVPW
jgi:hypothetical protein